MIPIGAERMTLTTRRVVFALLFVAAVFIGRSTRLSGSQFALVSPSPGIAFLWLSTTWGNRRESRIDSGLLFLVATLSILATGSVWTSSLVYGFANLIQGLVACLVYVRFRQRDDWELSHPIDLAALLVGSIAGSLASAVVGPLALDLYHGISISSVWNQWVLRNAVSTFVIAIIGLWLLSFKKLNNDGHRSTSTLESVAGWIVVVGAYAFVFSGNEQLPTAYLVLPLCAWVALRFSTNISAIYVFGVSVTIVVATLNGRGPFSALAPITGATTAESFVAIVAFLTLVLALLRDDQSRLERRFRGLLAAAPDSIVGVNAAGIIEIVSDRVESLFGWSTNELLGQQVEILVPELMTDVHVRHRANYVANPRPRQMGAGLHLLARRRDGTTFPVEISLNTIGQESGHMVTLASVRDITERLELEDERLQRRLGIEQERTQRLESLGQLAGGVAHDFNNILGVILNYSALVEEQVSDPRVVTDLKEIREAAERGAGLTRQLLTFARNDSASPEALDTNAVVRDLAVMLRRTFEGNIDFNVQLVSDPLVTVIDRHQLGQVIVNLAINARDAMLDGGQLTISTRRIAGKESAPDTPSSDLTVVLAITDTGVGMSPEVVAKAFDPFFTTKPVGQGTGLGLATVYGIVRRYNGEVVIDSVPGEGTTVSVFLPGTDENVALPKPARELPVRGSERILLVEDEVALRRATARILSEYGYETVEANDGVEALEIFDRDGEVFDLVLSDVSMPRMRGDQLALELMKRDESLKILLMTGYDSGDPPRYGRLIPKPLPKDDLLRAIREMLDS